MGTAREVKPRCHWSARSPHETAGRELGGFLNRAHARARVALQRGGEGRGKHVTVESFKKKNRNMDIYIFFFFK